MADEEQSDEAGLGPLHDALVAELPHLRRFAYYLTRGSERADDIAQETLARAVRHIGRLRPDSNLRAWLFTIARNVARNEARRQRRSPVDPHTDLADLQPAQAQSQDSAIELREMHEAVLRLPPAFRQTLFLCAIEGLSYEDAAEVMAVPIGTVRSRLARARLALERDLAGSGRKGRASAAEEN
ncbi:MAG: sigma-70 family RNA polymerase sigma factor [Reyranellaceae bacterium]